MTINELAEVVGETPRQIRYLIAEGFVPNPEGSRARPDYRDVHLEAIRRYQRLRRDYKPAQIKALFESEQLMRDGQRIALAPGVLLTIDPQALDPRMQARAVGDLAAAALETILQHRAQDTSDAA